MGPTEVREFLSHLAIDRNVSASTQAQALNALVFLFEKCWGVRLESLEILSARRAEESAVVLSPQEVRQLLAGLDQTSLCNPRSPQRGHSTKTGPLRTYPSGDRPYHHRKERPLVYGVLNLGEDSPLSFDGVKALEELRKINAELVRLREQN